MEQRETATPCGKSIFGKNLTNLKQHFKLAHPNVMKEVVSKGEAAKKMKSERESARRASSLKYEHQCTLKESLAKHNPYR